MSASRDRARVDAFRENAENQIVQALVNAEVPLKPVVQRLSNLSLLDISQAIDAIKAKQSS